MAASHAKSVEGATNPNEHEDEPSQSIAEYSVERLII